MGFFNWAAPMFHRSDGRWTDRDIASIAGWIRPTVPTGGTLLDVGGGTGALAARLGAALHAQATVLDPTPEMVRYVPSDAGIRVVLGSAEAMPLPDSSFDAAVVSDAFHHFRDQPAALCEIARVVRPGGCVLVLDLDAGHWATRIVAVIERLLGEPAAFRTPEEMVALMAEYGIAGRSTREAGTSYRFLGNVV